MEQYGEMFLSTITVYAMLAMVFSMLQPGGVINNIIVMFMQTICG